MSSTFISGDIITQPEFSVCQRSSASHHDSKRWDNVMMLEQGTPVKALTVDGKVTTGEIVGATIHVLRISSDSGEVSLAMADVTRVDRLAGPGLRQPRSGKR